jgi:hypothetical protein
MFIKHKIFGEREEEKKKKRMKEGKNERRKE